MLLIEWNFSNEFQLNHLENWYKKIVQNEGKTLGDISIILGSDEWLIEVNKQYLHHDYFTDIITFDYCENDIISGDLLISAERVFENAQSFNVSRETELNRVLVHGLLHLIGYNDKSLEEIKIMREKEDFYLTML